MQLDTPQAQQAFEAFDAATQYWFRNYVQVNLTLSGREARAAHEKATGVAPLPLGGLFNALQEAKAPYPDFIIDSGAGTPDVCLPAQWRDVAANNVFYCYSILPQHCNIEELATYNDAHYQSAPFLKKVVCYFADQMLEVTRAYDAGHKDEAPHGEWINLLEAHRQSTYDMVNAYAVLMLTKVSPKPLA